MNKVRRIINLSIPVIMILGARFTFGDAFTTQMQTVNSTVWGYVKIAVQIGCFIWFAIEVIQILISHGDKQTSWWKLLSLIAAILILQVLPTIYQTVTGTTDSPTGTTGTTP